MVRRAGLEPARSEDQGILNPWRLPLPPPGQGVYSNIQGFLERQFFLGRGRVRRRRQRGSPCADLGSGGWVRPGSRPGGPGRGAGLRF